MGDNYTLRYRKEEFEPRKEEEYIKECEEWSKAKDEFICYIILFNIYVSD